MSEIKIDTVEILDLREKFFKTSNSIFELDLDYGEIAVYCLLCRLSNNSTMKSYPSITYIQKALKMSRPKIISCINNLSKNHVILKKQYGKGLSSVYLLVNLSPLPKTEYIEGSKKETLGSKKETLPSKKEVLDKDLVYKDLTKKTVMQEKKIQPKPPHKPPKEITPTKYFNELYQTTHGNKHPRGLALFFATKALPDLKLMGVYERYMTIRELVFFKDFNGESYFKKYPNINLTIWDNIQSMTINNLYQKWYPDCNIKQERLYFDYRINKKRRLLMPSGNYKDYIGKVDEVLND